MTKLNNMIGEHLIYGIRMDGICRIFIYLVMGIYLFLYFSWEWCYGKYFVGAFLLESLELVESYFMRYLRIRNEESTNIFIYK
jgi:hypothetical protein